MFVKNRLWLVASTNLSKRTRECRPARVNAVDVHGSLQRSQINACR